MDELDWTGSAVLKSPIKYDHLDFVCATFFSIAIVTLNYSIVFIYLSMSFNVFTIVMIQFDSKDLLYHKKYVAFIVTFTESEF